MGSLDRFVPVRARTPGTRTDRDGHRAPTTTPGAVPVAGTPPPMLAGGEPVIEHELARSVLLERSWLLNSPEWRFRKEWDALRAEEALARERADEELRIDRLRDKLARAA